MVKKAKVDEAPQNAPADKGGKGGRQGSGIGGLARYTLITALASMLAIVIGSFAVQQYVIDTADDEESQRLATIYANQYTAYFNQLFQQVSRQLASVDAKLSLGELVASGDTARMQAVADTIAASLANKSQVFLFPASAPISDVPLGFTAQDMVDRTRRGEDVTGVIVPMQEKPLLLMAEAIRDANKNVVGTLLIGFDLNEIGNNLSVFDKYAGYVALRQTVEAGQDAQTVLDYGDESLAGNEHTVSIQTLNPYLTVSFSLNPDVIVSQTSNLYWGVLSGMLLLVLASIFATSMLLRRALQKNASMLLQYAESLVKRAPIPAGIQFTIDIFDDVAQSLNRTARSVTPESAAARPAPASAARKGAGDDILDVAIDEKDQQLLRSDNTRPASLQVPDEIFRAYDIRGIVGKTLTDDIMKLIGQAIGSEALDKNQSAIYVGRDGRLSGPQLSEALIAGITSTGCRVINLGMVPTPVAYFAAYNTATKSCISMTGSHNPPDYNGLKIVIAGETLAEQRIQALKERIIKGNFRTGQGTAETLDIVPKYNERIRDDIVLARPMKVVVDCGNGVAGAVAPQLLAALGCQVIPLYCDVDGHFPNHHPDPSKLENVADLIAKVREEKADIGLAFDGDGDRLGVVTPKGELVFPDRLMMLYSRDLLMRSPGADIIFDVKCTRDLASVISQHGGRPVMWRTGHSLIKAKLKETGALLAGEMSGHIFFNDRWFGFDDAIYSAARLLEILSLEVQPADEVFAEFPVNVSTPELNIKVTEESKFRIVEALQKQGEFPGGSITTIDGVRVDYPGGWGLVRASNTTPVLVARFEGRTEQDLEKVKAVFREQLAKVDSSLPLPF